MTIRCNRSELSNINIQPRDHPTFVFSLVCLPVFLLRDLSAICITGSLPRCVYTMQDRLFQVFRAIWWHKHTTSYLSTPADDRGSRGGVISRLTRTAACLQVFCSRTQQIGGNSSLPFVRNHDLWPLRKLKHLARRLLQRLSTPVGVFCSPGLDNTCTALVSHLTYSLVYVCVTLILWHICIWFMLWYV